jgi:dCMP deaminase
MRPDRDTWALQLALLTGQRSTCCRRQVGCVLLNVRGHVVATGYNGVAAGQKHCNEEMVYDVESPCIPAIKFYPHACAGAEAPSGTNLDACQAIHAEQNALLQCQDVYAIETCYVTASPCVTCTKLLLNTSTRRVGFVEAYPQPAAKELWLAAGRSWEQLLVKI